MILSMVKHDNRSQHFPQLTHSSHKCTDYIIFHIHSMLPLCSLTSSPALSLSLSLSFSLSKNNFTLWYRRRYLYATVQCTVSKANKLYLQIDGQSLLSCSWSACMWGLCGSDTVNQSFRQDRSRT